MRTTSLLSLPISVLFLIISCTLLLSTYVEARPRSGSMARDLGPDLYERYYGPDGIYAQQIYERSLPQNEEDNSTLYPIPTDITEFDVIIHPLRRSESECTPSIPSVPVQTGVIGGPLIEPSSDGSGQTTPSPQSGLSNTAMIEAKVSAFVGIWCIVIALFASIIL